MRLPPAVIGVIVAEGVWGLAWLALIVQWLTDMTLPDVFEIACMMIANPIAVGGWALIWGDNGPPYQWLESTLVNLVATFLLWGLVGFLIGSGVAKLGNGRRQHQE
ncbi:MAG: hypothetical protein WD049_09010 [Candidatus Paceibacterota bacterium]